MFVASLRVAFGLYALRACGLRFAFCAFFVALFGCALYCFARFCFGLLLFVRPSVCLLSFVFWRLRGSFVRARVQEARQLRQIMRGGLRVFFFSFSRFRFFVCFVPCNISGAACFVLLSGVFGLPFFWIAGAFSVLRLFMRFQVLAERARMLRYFGRVFSWRRCSRSRARPVVSCFCFAFFLLLRVQALRIVRARMLLFFP